MSATLVHRKVLTPNGAVYRAERAEPGRKVEFLASTDIWFRPVKMTNTPDGTLLVLDMYRETTEHPWSIPDDIKSHLDLTSGKDRGRLFEIIPDGFDASKRGWPKLEKASTGTLIALLSSLESWPRETAQRLLLARRDPSAIAALQGLAETGPTPQGRLHALWTLESLGGLTDALVLKALSDIEPGVRENAAKLAEERSPANGHNSSIHEKRLDAAADRDAMVRFQTALSLGFVTSPRRLKALAAIAEKDAADPWTRAAALSAVGDDASRFLDKSLAGLHDGKPGGGRAWLEDTAALIAARNRPDETEGVLKRLGEGKADPGAASAVLIGLQRGNIQAGVVGLLHKGNIAPLLGLFNRAEAVAFDDQTIADRIEAIRLLGLSFEVRHQFGLDRLLDAREPVEVQVEAIRTRALKLFGAEVKTGRGGVIAFIRSIPALAPAR